MTSACYTGTKRRESEESGPLVTLVRSTDTPKQIVYLDRALSVEYAIVTLKPYGGHPKI